MPLLAHPRAVAVGEVGLDRHADVPRLVQEGVVERTEAIQRALEESARRAVEEATERNRERRPDDARQSLDHLVELRLELRDGAHATLLVWLVPVRREGGGVRSCTGLIVPRD